MARSRTSNRAKPNKASETTEQTLLTVRQLESPVRIRLGPGLSYSHVGGGYLTTDPREVYEVVPGPGSKSGWGHLTGSGGWVAMDFVEIIS